MDYTIRKAAINDLTSICILMEELSGSPITRDDMTDRLNMVENSAIDSLYVCEENGMILGLMGFRIRENLEEATRYGEVSALVVNPEDRNKGVARFMMEYAEKLAEDANCIGTWLTSGFGREEAAHDFYKKLGYRINGYRFIKVEE